MSAPVIQAQYDDLEKIAERFAQQADLIEQVRQQVRQATDALKNGGWQGQGSDAFQAEMDGEIFPAVNRLSQALQEGNQSTHQIIEVIKAAEAEAAAPFRNGDYNGLVGSTTDTTGVSSGGSENGFATLKDFTKSVFSFGSKAVKVFTGIKAVSELVKNLDNFPGWKEFLSQYRTLGNSLKTKLGSTLGKLGLVAGAAGALFEGWTDYQSGESLTEVIVSEGTEYALETSLRLVAYTNPVSAVALTVWDGAVLLGDVADFNVPSLGAATDAVGNFVYDAGEAIADFGGGLIDDVGDAVSSLKFW